MKRQNEDREREEEQNDDNPVWEELDPSVWRNAVYSDDATTNCMGQLFLHEVNFFEEQIQSIKETYDKVALIEVGFGTAELQAKIMDDCDMVVGVELCQNMIDLAYKLHENLKEEENQKVKLLCGNATELMTVLKDKAYSGEHEFWTKSTFRLTCMCMNTFGILPDFIRGPVIKQMFMCSGPGGKLIIGCWHRDSLRVGFQEFYSQNPQLCGPCRESDFDFDKGNFVCSSSDYTSHWWTAEELKD